MSRKIVPHLWFDQRGVAPLGVLAVAVILAAIAGGVWWWQQDNKMISNEKQAQVYESKEAGYRFALPEDWIVVEGEGALQSQDYQDEYWEIGASNVTRGAQIIVGFGEETAAPTIDAAFAGSFADRFGSEPQRIMIGKNGDIPALQYSIQYEGPAVLITEFILNDLHYSVLFQSAGDEKTSVHYGALMDVLGSMEIFTPQGPPRGQSLKPSISISSPNGGENLNPIFSGGYSKIVVTFSSAGGTHVDGVLFRESGGPVYEYCDIGNCSEMSAIQFSSGDASDAFADVVIPENIISANDYKIRIALSAPGDIVVAEDVSDQPFTIMNSTQ